MKYLAYNTSIGVEIILCDGVKTIEFCDDEITAASEVLLPKTDEMLKSLGMTLSDLDVIVVFVGPGSFTGIRIGVNTARAFAYALKIPLVGIDNLSAYSLALNGEGNVVTYGWGRNFYVAHFSSPFIMDGSARSLTLDELNTLVGETVCDSKTAKYTDFSCVADRKELEKQAIARKLKSGVADEFDAVLPFYVSPSQAERELNEKKAGK
jgi:tRNA threonylcarbamoyl adenosine modification protein YeaZ